MAGYSVLFSWDAFARMRASRRERTRRRLIERALREWRGMLRPPRLGVA
ncbi:MAG: hypothetical protein M3Y58_11065 [Chloroflexota bacterium]|nr:hypothetical protein [Chloroflexota bacterium]